MIVGYARVSTIGQKLDVQLEKLKDCEKVFQEKESSSKQRQQLQACLDFVREGDTLVVSRLDRLARSTLHLCRIVELLEEKKVDLHVIDQSIDTSTPTGRLLFHMLAAIAEFETELRRERQMDGIRKAQEAGVKFGRQKSLSPEAVQEMCQARKDGALIKELMQRYGASKSTVYRYLAEEDA